MENSVLTVLLIVSATINVASIICNVVQLSLVKSERKNNDFNYTRTRDLMSEKQGMNSQLHCQMRNLESHNNSLMEKNDVLTQFIACSNNPEAYNKVFVEGAVVED